MVKQIEERLGILGERLYLGKASSDEIDEWIKLQWKWYNENKAYLEQNTMNWN